MKKVALAVLMFGTVALAFADAAPKPPADVRKFINDAESCEHFAGEFDSGLSAARQKELNDGIAHSCSPAKKQAVRLQKKYKDQPEMLDLIKKTLEANDAVENSL